MDYSLCNQRRQRIIQCAAALKDGRVCRAYGRVFLVATGRKLGRGPSNTHNAASQRPIRVVRDFRTKHEMRLDRAVSSNEPLTVVQLY